MVEQPALTFGGLLRQLRADALLTQEELAEAARLSPRSVSDLERGVNKTARKDTADLLAEALRLAGPVREVFVAAARGRRPAADVLAARDGGTPGANAARTMRECPYRGLLPFGEPDAEVFYGRERLAAELAVKAAARAAEGGPVVVTGASGSGKTSLLLAGLLPILARGQQIPGSQCWPRVVMTPTKDPLTELAAQLAAVGGPDALAVRDELARHPDRAHLAIRSAVLAAARRDAEPQASGDGDARLVLIVDQFEQVFTLNTGAAGEDGGQAFITALCAAAANPAGPAQQPAALVVLAVRGDFWDRCAAVPELVGALQDGQFVVGPMTESELRVAITGPAEAAGLRMDPGLTDTILGDLRAADADRSAGLLPLLSQAMALTWEHRDADLLTSHGYARAGGVSRAVQTVADRCYDALPAGQQAIARQVLRGMTVTGRDGAVARRPVIRADLYGGLPDASHADIDTVLESLAAERLAVLDENTAQLSHDVLLRAWPRLRRWLDDDRASWIVHGQLADAAAAWHDSHDDPSFLYRGAQLATARQAAARWSASPAGAPTLTATQRDFLHASQRAAARGTRRRRGGIALLALLTALAVTAAGFAYSQRATAIRQRDQVLASQVNGEALQYAGSDTTLAAQLTSAAYRLQPTQDLASRLLNTENTPMSGPPLAADHAAVGPLEFSPDGHTLASITNNYLRLWDVADPAHPRRVGGPLGGNDLVADSMAFSPAGHVLVVGTADHTIELWNVDNAAHPRLLGQPLAGAGAVYSAAFSPDGQTLAAGDSDGTIRLLDVADPARPRLLGQPSDDNSSGVDSLAFSSDGRTLAATSYTSGTQLWDVADRARPRPLGQLLATVQSVVFNPGGPSMATSTADGTIQLWNVANPAHPSPLGPPAVSNGSGPVPMAFSPGGHLLASTGGPSGLGIQLWDVGQPARLFPVGQPLVASSTATVMVVFSPDGRTLASGAADGTIRLWGLPQTILTGSFFGDSVAFSRDGRTLTSGTGDGTIRLWDVGDSARPRPLSALTGGGDGGFPVSVVSLRPGGSVLASGYQYDGTIQLWDIADPARPRPLGRLPVSGSDAVNSIAFSSDGRVLAASTFNSTIRLWDVANPVAPRLLSLTSLGADSYGNTIGVLAVAFSPGGRTLAIEDSEGAIRLWDAADPEHPRSLSKFSDNAASMAFSPDGRTLASGTDDGTIRLWDVADPAHPVPLGRPLTSSAKPVMSVAFSLDGHTLASGNGEGTIRLWDVADPAHPVPQGQPLTVGTEPVSSVAFSPDGHTLASDDVGTIQLWNLNVQYAIERICAAAGALTPAQWQQYIPQLGYQPSCAN